MHALTCAVQPIMIHRAILGSIERFFGILIENYAGAFPLWLAPVQARLIPVVDKPHLTQYCDSIVAKMRAAGIRAEVARGEKVSFRKQVRNAETSKIPVMLVVGDKECE